MDQILEILNQVETLREDGNEDKAIELLEQSIIKYNNSYKLYEELADIYLYNGNLAKAEKSVDFALELEEKSSTGNYLKGFILLSKENFKESIKYLEKSNNSAQNNAEVLRNLGWCYTMVGQEEKGILILKRALILCPEDNLVTEDLAMALISSGKLNEGNHLLEQIGKVLVNK